MGASTRKVNIEAGVVKYDSDMPMGALRGLLAAANEGDLGALMDSMGKFVVEWPFAGDPSDPEAWDALRRSEFNALTEAVMQDLGDSGKA